MSPKDKFKSLLEQTGIRIHGNKINKSDFRKIFGAKYIEPEWVLLHEDRGLGNQKSSSDGLWNSPPQQQQTAMPPFAAIDLERYVSFIESEETKLNRVILPLTYSFAHYGNFTAGDGNVYPLIGFVYQYSLKGNPRNVHYAYRLFLQGRNFSKNAGFPSLQEIRTECSKEAKDAIETKLFDLT